MYNKKYFLTKSTRFDIAYYFLVTTRVSIGLGLNKVHLYPFAKYFSKIERLIGKSKCCVIISNISIMGHDYENRISFTGVFMGAKRAGPGCSKEG